MQVGYTCETWLVIFWGGVEFIVYIYIYFISAFGMDDIFSRNITITRIRSQFVVQSTFSIVIVKW